MKSNLTLMLLGSFFYNLYQLFTVGGERYSYAAGLLITLLVVSKFIDSLGMNIKDPKEGVKNENVQTDDEIKKIGDNAK